MDKSHHQQLVSPILHSQYGNIESFDNCEISNDIVQTIFSVEFSIKMSTHVQYQTQFKFNSIHSVRIIEICEVPHSLQFWLLCFYVPIFANFFTLINCQGCGFFSMKSRIWIDKNDIDTRFLLLFLLRPKQELIVNISHIYSPHGLSNIM